MACWKQFHVVNTPSFSDDGIFSIEEAGRDNVIKHINNEFLDCVSLIGMVENVVDMFDICRRYIQEGVSL